MKIFNLIKKRASTRSFTKKKISSVVLSQILEAGIWGPYISGFQLARFVVIKRRSLKLKICNLIKKNYKKLGISGRAIFFPATLKVLEEAPILIAVYNSGEFTKLINRFARVAKNSRDKAYLEVAKKTEYASIYASMQNMIIIAENLSVGSCWLSIPLFFENEISCFLKTDNELVAMLALGYKAEKGKRSARKITSAVVKFL